MPRRHESFTFDPLNHKPWECWRWCKVHYYWSFESEMHIPYPNGWNILTSRFGWENVTVFCGPPGYYPKKPRKEKV